MSDAKESVSDNALVQYEAMYAEQPDRYRRKVRGWMWLGYGYVVGVILLLVLFVAGGSYLFFSGTLPIYLADNFLKIGVPAVLLGGVMARGFFVRIPLPEGHRLTGDLKNQVVDFFNPTRELCNGPKIDDVFIDTRLNAAVQQSRAFGIVGPTRNYLILGAPLLELATADEIRAIIAHEFGHLNRAHGKMGASVYRLYSTLFNSARAIEEKSDSGADGIAFKFFRWFIPKFDELTFAMRRGQEYEADRTAADATSKEAIASGLCRLDALDHALDGYWEGLWEEARQLESASDASPFDGMHSGVYAKFSEEAARNAVEHALQRQTDYSDTHPCLRERLASIAAEPVFNFDCERPAFTSMFNPDAQQEVRRIANEQWCFAISEDWQRIHGEHQEAKAELERLRSKASSLQGDELLSLAGLEERYGDPAVARQLFGGAASADAASPSAQYHGGRTLLQSDFSVAQKRLLRAAQLDDDYLPSVASLLHDELTSRELADELATLDEMIETYNTKQRVAKEERNKAALTDEFKTVALPGDLNSRLQEQLDARPGLRALYLVEKAVEHFADHPVYIAGAEISYFSDDIDSNQERWLSSLVDELEALLGERATVIGIVLDEDVVAWKERLAEIPDSLVHSKPDTGWLRKTARGLGGVIKWALKWVALVIGITIAILLADYFGLLELFGFESFLNK